MNIAELIRELYKFQPDTEVVLLNDEFSEYFSPTKLTKHKLGTYERDGWNKDNYWPRFSIRDTEYNPDKYKLIKKQDYVLIG